MAKYSSKIANLCVVTGNKKLPEIKFSGGLFEATEDWQEKLLDNLKETNPAVGRHYRKVDEEAARKQLEAYLASQQQAVKGGITSANATATDIARDVLLKAADEQSSGDNEPAPAEGGDKKPADEGAKTTTTPKLKAK